MTLKLNSLLASAGLALGGALISQAQADTIAITNPDFTDGTTGYSSFLDVGEAGQNSMSNPYGSTGLMYGIGSTSTAGSTGAPVATAGEFTLDAGGVANPGGPYPDTSIIFYEGAPSTNIRIDSTNGSLGDLYQDTGVTFAANTTYVLSAYVAGQGHGNSNDSFLGVGLSGNTNLTLSEIETNDGFTPVDGFNSDGTPNENGGIVGPDYTSLVSLTENPGNGNYVKQTLTLNTAVDTDLVGQDIIVNLLANSDPYYGDGQYVTDVSLTYSANVPEPSTYLLGGWGLLLFLVLRRRSSARA